MRLDDLMDLPVVAAPMAGGASTVALARAVASAGGLPFLAGGYLDADGLSGRIAELREDVATFGVNLFVPSSTPVDPQAFASYAGALEADARRYGLRLDPVPHEDGDGWDEKVALLVADPVPVVSLTFGLPDPADIRALRSVGTLVWASVTTPAEAVEAADAGVDGLVVQGCTAGGHSAVFDPATTPPAIPTADLVRLIRSAVDLPVVATGGIDGPRSARTLLDAGAVAVAAGTLFLRTDEAGTSAAHRRALADPRFEETVITRAFTGRPARALRNGFVDAHREREIAGYPAVHHLTTDLRRAAAAAGDLDSVHLWAGTGWRSAPSGPAADVVRWLTGD